jgi:two-component system NtrC family sensor kinase
MSINNKKVLVVEDEPAIGHICRETLRAAGLIVDIASDGKAAQKKIEKERFDLYLVDVRMPEMSDIELCQWLHEKYPHLADKIMFTTGSVMGGETMRFLEQSGRPVLLKPFTPDELKSAVMKALKKIEKKNDR